jgi:hypothetical protein
MLKVLKIKKDLDKAEKKEFKKAMLAGSKKIKKETFVTFFENKGSGRLHGTSKNKVAPMGTSNKGPASVIAGAKEEVEETLDPQKLAWVKYLAGAKSHMSAKQWNKIPAAERALVDKFGGLDKT